MLRDAINKPAITTDIIVGFPGETDAEFEQTLQTCRAAGFSKIHAFPFSARKGTPAADMPNQLPGDLKNDRVHQLGRLELELRRDYFASLVGEDVQVLVESQREFTTLGKDAVTERLLRGTTCRYAPAEWVTENPNLGKGSMVTVKVIESNDDRLLVRTEV